MKRKSLLKIILLGIICSLLAGCTVDYNIVIDSKNRVKENIVINIPNNKLLGDKSPKKELNRKINDYKKIPSYNHYEFKTKVKNDYSIVNIKSNYENLEAYADSPILNDLYENITIIENKNYTIFKTVGSYNYDYLYGTISEPIGPVGERPMKDVSVTIQLHNKLIESNADSVDEKNNVYTWNFSPDQTSKFIYIKYSNEKRYDVIIKSFIKNNIGIFIIGSSIIVGILVLALAFYIRIWRANKI